MRLWDCRVITIEDTGQKADHMIDYGEKLSGRNDYFKDLNSSKKHTKLSKVILVRVIKQSTRVEL
jgi:hypothetical protein